MARTFKEIREEALRLTPRQRWQLVQDLHASLMTAEEREVEEAWLDEVERRVQSIEDGTARMIPSEEVFRKLRAKYAARR